VTAKELRENFEKALVAIQDACPHSETETMPYMWAPGHISGMVTVCKYCEKIITQFNECSTGTVTVSNNESVK
jgi:hypothetical protein